MHEHLTGSLTGWLRGQLPPHPPHAKAEGRSLSLSWGGGIPGAGARQLDASCTPVGA